MDAAIINYIFHDYVEPVDLPKTTENIEQVISDLSFIKAETDAHIRFTRTGEFSFNNTIAVDEEESLKEDTQFNTFLHLYFDEISEAVSKWDTEYYEEPTRADYKTKRVNYPSKNRLKYWGELTDFISDDIYQKNHEDLCFSMLDIYFDEISPLTGQKMLLIFNEVDHEEIMAAIKDSEVTYQLISSSAAKKRGLSDIVIGRKFNRIATLLNSVSSTLLERSQNITHIDERILRRYTPRQNFYGAEIRFNKNCIYYVNDFPPEEFKNEPTMETLTQELAQAIAEDMYVDIKENHPELHESLEAKKQSK